MEVGEAVRTLRATRCFSHREVPLANLARWLNDARWCGSSRNSQPWRFIVVRSPTTRKALAGLGDDALHLALAPVVVALAAVEGRYPQSGLFDMGRVAQSVMVSAHADGVGSCIAAFEPAENIAEARRLLGVPGSMHLDWALSLGYPAIRPDAPTEMAVGGGSPPGRMPMSAVVFWERFGEVSAPTR